ncbi:MAG: UDP-N-acetylmuramate dehydrogenase [Candidatus Magasanikbacteria bacterium]
MRVRKNIPLSKYTTLKTGGRARYMAWIEDEKELEKVIQIAKSKGLDFDVLGGGSNVLAPQKGFDGLIIKINIYEKSYDSQGKTTLLKVGAGQNWDSLVKETTSKGLWGIENLSGIPGTVGAAPIQNIGAYGQEVSKCIEYVKVFSLEKMNYFKLKPEACKFGYRDSIFKNTNNSLIITEVAFRLQDNSSPCLEYNDLRDYFSDYDYSPNVKDVRKAVLDIRKNKFPSKKEFGTAGSFFKNPVISQSKYNELKGYYENLPGHEKDNGQIKIPLAWIFDKLFDLNGYSEKGVRFFEKQPLVVVNEGRASSKDILKVTQKVARKVKNELGIELQREVRGLEGMGAG